jgi:hypothetical protein
MILNKGRKFSNGGTVAMSVRISSITLFLGVLVFTGASRASAQTPPPALFFTDLTSAPNTGNSDTTVGTGNGAYVTLYGNNFGTSQGTSIVTWSGQNCLTVVPSKGGSYTGWGSPHLWYQEIVVQIGSACTPGTGNFVVTTSTGTSNGLPFTVRSLGTNKIYFVATGGSDNNPGTYTSPFATIPRCAGEGASSAERAGDICYVEDGVNQTTVAGFGGLTLSGYAGTATLPLAIGTYPGASSTIGTNSIDKGMVVCYQYVPQCSTPEQQYLTVFGFHVRGVSYAISVQSQFNRMVALEAQCPNSGNGTNLGCFNTIDNNETLLGNEISNVGQALAPGGTCGKLCHNLYIGYVGGNGFNFEIGWNSSHDANGGRLIQFFNGSAAGYNINIHDNLLYNNVGVDGMAVDGDADLGYVNIYNNLIYHVGQTPDEAGDAVCLYLLNTAGTVSAYEQVYNNTMYDCSHNNSISYGMFSPLVRANLQNNIFYATIAGEPYVASSCSSNGCASNLTGSNNIWFGGTAVPSQTTGNITANPLFVANGSNFKLQSSSPAIGAGVGSWTGGSTSTHDIAGLLRPSPPSIGAFELTAGSPPTLPNPPTNLAVVVN